MENVSEMSGDNKKQIKSIESLREKYLAVEKQKHQLEKQIFWLNANLRTKRKAEFEKALLQPDGVTIDQEAQTLQSVLLAESEKLVSNLNEVKNELALKDSKIKILEAKIAVLEKRETQQSEKLAKNTGENETKQEKIVTDARIGEQEAQIQALEIKIKALETSRADRQKIQLMETSEEERDIARQNEALAQRLRELGIEKRKLLQQINDLVQEKKEAKKEDSAKKKRLRSFDLRDDDIRNEPFIRASFKQALK